MKNEVLIGSKSPKFTIKEWFNNWRSIKMYLLFLVKEIDMMILSNSLIFQSIYLWMKTLKINHINKSSMK